MRKSCTNARTIGAEIMRMYADKGGTDENSASLMRVANMSCLISRATEGVATSNLMAGIGAFERDWEERRDGIRKITNWGKEDGQVDGDDVDSAFSATELSAIERTRLLSQATMLHQTTGAGIMPDRR